MKKFVCTICGYVHEGDDAPEKCPQCGAAKGKFIEKAPEGKIAFADEHRIGVAKNVDAEVLEGLRAHFTGECCEVGMYLAMSRQADREGYPEVAEAYKRIAFEEAEHAAKFAELLGEVVVPCTKTNLTMRVAAETGACAGEQARDRQARQGARLRCDPRHRSRDVQGRGAPRRRVRRIAEALLRQVIFLCRSMDSGAPR